MLDAAIGFVGRILLQIFFEAVVEGILYSLKRFWYAVTGQKPKAIVAMDYHELMKLERRDRIEQIRQRQSRKTKR